MTPLRSQTQGHIPTLTQVHIPTLTIVGPSRDEDDISSYLRANRSKQKALRRANPKKSADQYQAVTLAQQEAQRARERQEERARLQSEAREKLVNSVKEKGEEERYLGREKGAGEAEKEVEGVVRGEGEEEMHHDSPNWSNEDMNEDKMGEESVDAGAGAMEMEVEEGNDGSLFCPMGSSPIQGPNQFIPQGQTFQPYHQGQTFQAFQQGQSIQDRHQGQSGYPVQQGRSLQPGHIAPMAPMQSTSRRSVGPGETLRRYSVQRDDNARQFDNRYQDGNAGNFDAMREDTPYGRSSTRQTSKSYQSNQPDQPNQALNPNQFNQSNQALASRAPSQTPFPTQTFDLTTSDSRKRKRETLSNHQDISSIIKSLERLHQQQTLDIASRDNEIMRQKLQLSDLHSLTTHNSENQSTYPNNPGGETMAQQIASLRTEVASLRQQDLSSSHKIQDLQHLLHSAETELEACSTWTTTKSHLEAKMYEKEGQLSQAQEQVSKFMEAFRREAALRGDVVKKLESGERFIVKLAKDLKRKDEELRLGREGREKLGRLQAAGRGLFSHIQMETMSGEKFGDVGQALKRVKDLVFEEGEEENGGGNGKRV